MRKIANRIEKDRKTVEQIEHFVVGPGWSGEGPGLVVDKFYYSEGIVDTFYYSAGIVDHFYCSAWIFDKSYVNEKM